MTNTIIICVTVAFCVVYITWFIYFMATNELPMFLWGQCVKEEPETLPPAPKTSIGFVDTAEVKEDTPEEKVSDREAMEKVLQDTASTISALLRGEVDFDEIKRN